MSTSENPNVDALKSSSEIHDAASDMPELDIPEAELVGPAELAPIAEWRWWAKVLIQPVIFFGLLVATVSFLGVAQMMGLLSIETQTAGQDSSGEGGRYICPMLCTPPQSEPGRCPVCKMELVPATSSSGSGGASWIDIDQAARRVAKIETMPVKTVALSRTIRTVGELHYDEGTLKTISAYVDGRLERLYADYTGVEVKKADNLVLIYSPRLYSGQVELLLAKKAKERSKDSTLARVAQSSTELYESSKQRLIELGMTASQIEQLEQSGKASSRLHIHAPIGGTVIAKLAEEGEYVKEGQAIYKLADLSTVWLMLKLFPEDAATVHYGQQVQAEIQSLPGETFTGRVAFIDKNVDPKTRTVGVRVVIPNTDGRLRVGDYASANIDVQVGQLAEGGSGKRLYDPELAGKFVSPRHPHIISDEPGDCPICGIKLIPASELGYSETPVEAAALVVPRNAVLMAGQNSVIYVETKPGRFEIRPVVLGPSIGEDIVIISGVSEDEEVATRGNFLIDSQMQLAGNPSLIDPTKAQPSANDELSPEVMKALAKLPDEDRALAEKQRVCPVADFQLGGMGTPIKVDVNGTPVFICCEGCRQGLLDEPEKYLAKLARGATATTVADAKAGTDESDSGLPGVAIELEKPPMSEAESAAAREAQSIAKAIGELIPEEQSLARRQKMCPVAGRPLGSMGKPIKVKVSGRAVFICCEGCRDRLINDPNKYFSKLRQGDLR